MTKSFWTLDKKVIVDAQGRPIFCDECPCPCPSSSSGSPCSVSGSPSWHGYSDCPCCLEETVPHTVTLRVDGMENWGWACCLEGNGTWDLKWGGTGEAPNSWPACTWAKYISCPPPNENLGLLFEVWLCCQPVSPFAVYLTAVMNYSKAPGGPNDCVADSRDDLGPWPINCHERMIGRVTGAAPLHGCKGCTDSVARCGGNPPFTPYDPYFEILATS